MLAAGAGGDRGGGGAGAPVPVGLAAAGCEGCKVGDPPACKTVQSHAAR